MSEQGTRKKDLTPAQKKALLAKLLKKKAEAKKKQKIQLAPTSFAQDRLWFLMQLEPTSTAYNIPTPIRVRGPLDLSVLNQALTTIVQRHEALRTTFSAGESHALQNIRVTPQFQIEHQKIAPEADLTQQIEAITSATLAQPFDLVRGPLFRAVVTEFSPDDYLFIFIMHHIISDGTSTEIFIRELGALYHAFATGADNPLPKLPIQYPDYAQWQRDYLQGDKLQQQITYWKEALQGWQALDLPTDFPRPNQLSLRGRTVMFSLSQATSDRMHALCQSGTTLYMILLALFQVLLKQYSNQDDICVGTPIAGRKRTELQDLIGFFINTLVMRTDLSAQPSFTQLLSRVKETALDAYAHQDLPFEKIVEALQPDRDMSRNPFFQVMFTFQNYQTSEPMVFQGLRIEPVTIKHDVAKFDITLTMGDNQGRIAGGFEYNTDLFQATTITQMIQHFTTLADTLMQNPDQNIDTVCMISAQEKDRLLTHWHHNAYRFEHAVDTLHAPFEAQAELHPHRIALRFAGQSVTYAQLNQQANQLAHDLLAQAVVPGDYVAVCLDRSIALVVSLIAILKVGAAYVPIDPQYPSARIHYMLTDVQPRLVLSNHTYQHLVPAHLSQYDVNQTSTHTHTQNPTQIRPGPVAYVIYTSGSTGNPKGVKVPHSAIVNHMQWMQADFPLGETDNVLQKTPFSFDASVWEFWAPLWQGATLVLAKPDGHKDAEYLIEILQQEQISILQGVPSLVRMLLESPGFSGCQSLRRLFCGGEQLNQVLVNEVKAILRIDIINLYGPTEAAIDSTFYRAEVNTERAVVPIGKPIHNANVYVLNPALVPVPIGVPGELYIGGAGVTLGYLNQTALTDNVFIQTPLDPGRLYKTGDRVRWLASGELEFCRRIDHQVKLRGYRIELGEIEAALSQVEGILNAAVLVREDMTGGPRLVGYYQTDTELNRDALVQALKGTLPDYMVPSDWMKLAEFPLSPSGKIDRKQLPKPDLGLTKIGNTIAPRSHTEQILAAIWGTILGRKHIGAYDHFFDAGGHSLLGTQLVSQVRERFQIEIPLKAVFEYPVLADQASQIDRLIATSQGIESLPLIPTRTDTESAPLSFAQTRLWFLSQLEPNQSVYNIPIAIRLHGALDKAALQAAVDDLYERQQSLRTYFVLQENQPLQKIDPDTQLAIDWQSLAADEAEPLAAAITQVQHFARTPFRLDQDKLFRVLCLAISTDDHVLAINIHHIISDGWSSGVLIKELTTLYLAHKQGVAAPLPALKIQYADYAAWQREWLQGERLDAQMLYWKKALKDTPERIHLIADKPRPPVQTFNGKHHAFEIPAAIKQPLDALCRAEQATLYMVLMAAYHLLLSRYARQQDICVGTPVAGRQQAEVEPLIGYFINAIVIRSQVTPDITGKAFLAQIKDTILGAFAHQDVPFESLIEAVNIERNLSYPPVVQVGFALQNTPMHQAIEFPDLRIEGFDFDVPTSKLEMTLIMMEVDGTLTGAFEYNTDLFRADTIARMAQHFTTVLSALVEDITQPLQAYTLYNDADLFALLDLSPTRYARILPLTPVQRDLYLATQVNPETPYNGIGIGGVLSTPLDIQRWRQALQITLDHQPALRMQMIPSKWSFTDFMYQAEEKHPDIDLTYWDWSHKLVSDAHLQATLRDWVFAPYPLGSPLFQCLLVKQADARFVAVTRSHHVLGDGAAGTLFFHFAMQTYMAMETGATVEHPKPIFLDYIQEAQTKFDRSATLDYWRKTLTQVEALDFAALPTAQSECIVEQTHLKGERFKAFKSIARQHKATPAVMLKILYGLLIQHYCRPTSDFIVSEVKGGRTRQHLRAVGCYFQQNPLRFDPALLTGTESLIDVVTKMKAEQKAMAPFQDISISQQYQLQPQGRLHFLYNFYNFTFACEFEGTPVELVLYTPLVPENQVQLVLEGTQTQIKINLTYHTSVFNGYQFLQRLDSLIDQLIAGASDLQSLDFLLPEDKTLIASINQTTRKHAPALTHISAGFDLQAQQHAERIAVICADEQMTYRALYQRSNQLSHLIHALRLKSEAPVAICMHRSPCFIVAILGALKAGCSYIPIDPDYPKARMQHILTDSHSDLLITDQALDSFDAFDKTIFQFKDYLLLDEQDAEPLDIDIEPRQIAYQIYTSGSTGQPKGVGVEHRGVVNLLQWYIKTFDMGPSDRTLVISALGFDLTQKNLFAPLWRGGTIVFPAQAGYHPEDILHTIESHHVTLLNCAPSAFYPLVALEEHDSRMATLRYVFLGGEPIQKNQVARWYEQADTVLVNSYGPTECTDIAAYHIVDKADIHSALELPIGRPNDNVRLYVLNHAHQLSVPGVPGELWIAGLGVGRGYIQDREKTNQSFIRSPIDRKGYLYRTGDLVRQHSDGSILFLGRLDHQVKLRGLRIELGEIESQIAEQAGVSEVVVVVKNDQLAAYYTGSATATTLKQALQQTLPAYMLPNRWMNVPALPLTPNGKIDRKNLPALDAHTDTPHIEARNDLERLLVDYWQQLLSVPRIGVKDSFFDLGGHSLLATQLISWVRDRFEVDLALRELFENPSIESLAQQIERAKNKPQALKAPPITPVARDIPLPLSYAQERLWFLDQLEPDNAVYNIPAGIQVIGAFQADLFYQALTAVVQRHEALRTTFKSLNGQPTQHVHANLAPTWDTQDIREQSADSIAHSIQQVAKQQAMEPFKLAQGPLLRGACIRTADDRHALYLTMHHIISDGWSSGILLREVATLYLNQVNDQAIALPPLPIQYADYAHWQRHWLKGDVLSQHLDYWREQLQGAPAVLRLPTDKPRPPMQTFKGAVTPFQLHTDSSQALQKTCQRFGCTPFMLLLTAYQIVLSQYTKQTDISVGSPIAGRTYREVEGLIGFFINGIVLRTDLSANPSGETLIHRVKETVLGAFAHQDLPVEMIVEALQPERNLSYPPLAQVGFALQNTPMQAVSLPGLSFQPIETESVTSKYDMTLIMSESGHDYVGLIEYNTDLFHAATIDTFRQHFEKILIQLMAAPEQPIQDYGLVEAAALIPLLGLNPEYYDRVLPLTPMQRDLAFESELNPDTLRNSGGIATHLRVPIQIDLWQRAVDTVFQQHIVSRIHLVKSNVAYLDTLYQALRKHPQTEVVVEDHSDKAWSPTQISQYISGLMYQPYDIFQDRLIGHVLLKIRPDYFVQVMQVNHIVLDGAGGTFLANQIVQAYAALSESQPYTAQDVVYDEYINFARAQFDQAEHSAYWQAQLAHVEPLDFPVALEHANTHTIDQLTLRADAWKQIKQFCRKSRLTPALLFKALYGLLIQVYCRAEQDFVIYEITGGRQKGYLRAPGLFYQQIPFVFPHEAMQDTTLLADYLDFVKNHIRTLGSRQYLSLMRQAQIIPKGRLQFFYNYYNFSMGFDLFGTPQTTEQFTPPVPEDQVQLILKQDTDSLEINLDYHERQFLGQGFTKRLYALAQQLIAGAEKISDLHWLTQAEQHTLLHAWNETEQPLPQAHSVLDLIFAQTEKTPDQIAVVQGQQSLSYRALDQQSTQLAHALRNQGLNPQEAVGILTHRSPYFILSVLAVMKAGGCYIPLDPDYPLERLQMISDDARLRFLLTESTLDIPLPQPSEGWGDGHIKVDLPRSDETMEFMPHRVKPTDRLYQIYTSGSTGRPKGVAVSHQNELNLIQWYTREFAWQAQDAVIIISALGFDLTQKNLFAPLCVGGKIIFPTYDHYDVNDLLSSIHQHQASLLNCAPSALYPLVEDTQHWPQLTSLRCVLLGGEGIQLPTLSPWLTHNNTQLVNMYGPTECTDIAAYHVLTDEAHGAEANIPIGRPNDNVALYVLSPSLKPVPAGVVGELYIAGMGVGEGYVDDPEKTQDAFIQHAFDPDTDAQRLYKTGDLVRYQQDGALIFIGRVDHQVKLRGLRIELGEISAVLMGLMDVEHAVATVIDAHIVLYYTGEASTPALQQQAQKSLAHYMLPSTYLQVTAFPLTPNGKIDFNALPQPKTQQQTYVAPRNDKEQAFTTHWQALLGLEQVGVLDNFFQIGGHSLLATQVIAWVREQYAIDLPLRTLFEQPTIAGLADQVEIKQRAGESTSIPDIVATPRTEPIPLSFAQERLWFIDQFAGGSVAYHMPGAIRVRGPLDLAALNTAYQGLLARHEVLRSYFVEQQGQLVQQWHTDANLHMLTEDISALQTDDSQLQGKIYQLFFQLASQPFNLSTGPLIRFKTLLCGENDSVLMFCMHHIISDGWSMQVFIQELVVLYQSALFGIELPLPELHIQYADYAVWQRQWLSGEVLAEHLAYWVTQLQDVPVLRLPTDHKRPLSPSQQGDTIRFKLSAATHDRVMAFSQAQGVTTFMTLLSCYAVFLSKYTGQSDICVGTPVAGRSVKALEPLIGFFINTLPLRISLTEPTTLHTLVQHVRDNTLAAFAHQDIPFEKIVEQLNVTRDSTQTPIFQTLFTLQAANQQTQSMAFEDLQVEPIEFDVPVAKFDLSTTLSDSGDGFYATFEYRSDLFSKSTMERMSRHFQTLIEHLIQHPLENVGAVSMLNADESDYWLGMGQMTTPAHPAGLLHEAISAQVHASPEAIAVRDAEQSITYASLERRSNQLANQLMAEYVLPGQRVAVCLHRSVDLVVALFAVLKAGAAYVPIDPDYPAARVDYMLQDCGATWLIQQGEMIKLPSTVSSLDLNTLVWADSVPTPNVNISPDNPAYVIYTSGSTGRPKGVLIAHRSIINHMLWMQHTFPLGAKDRVLQKTPYSFDASVWEFWAPLMQGASLVMAKPAGHKDPGYLCDIIAAESISVLQAVPALLSAMSQQANFADCQSLRTCFCGGEILPQALARSVLISLPKCQVVNLYGPTEATIDSTYCIADITHDRDSVPIGKPIHGAAVYVLDDHFNPVPEGVAGELCLAGAGLALGYHAQPELSAQAFIPHPFSEEDNARLYKTGDLVRWLSDGRLEYIGRKDQQVKLRGYRIELGEIENAITEQAGVDNAVVIVREDRPGDQRLVAYVIGRLEESMKQAVAGLLPDYMLPNLWMSLATLPLSPSGKIDRHALPKPDISTLVDYVAPEGEIQQLLADIWATQLGLDKISVIADFFSLGGHSLLAVKITSQMEVALGRPVPLAALFQYPSIEKLTQWLHKPQLQSPLVMLNENPDLPLLFCIHPVGGQAIVFRHIAEHLRQQYAMVGLEAIGLSTDDTPLMTIPDMANAYLKAIRSLQAEGPYEILGYSMGGLIAYDMAQILHAEGTQTRLILLDTETPAFSQQNTSADSSFLNEMIQTFETQSGIKLPIEAANALLSGFDIGQTQGTLSSAEIKDLVEQLMEALGMENEGTELIAMQRMIHVLIANTQAIRSYTPDSSEQPIALLLAEARGTSMNTKLVSAWASLVTDIHTDTIAGNHADLVLSPPAAKIARWIMDCLAR